jgi:GTP-binding protein HflX
MMAGSETFRREQAVVVGVTKKNERRHQLEDHLDELILLADTAGVQVAHRMVQERENIDRATVIGKGKVRELAEVVENGKLDIVIFDDDLTPVQIRNLEHDIKCKIMDRSGLILDIFASRAKTKEAITQVELAQLQYMLPRLTRQWTHLSRQYGGVGTKGPGETQIETDRRAIRRRISILKEKLDGIAMERVVQRKHRKEKHRVALVGYTNAGKSTLLKAFSGADVLIEDRLFATLDTTVRKVQLTATKEILLSDTVGFIRKLPTHLVASFKSTLAEVVEADCLLHVVDCSHAEFADHIKVVQDTLDEIGAAGKPTILVFNKIDLLGDRSTLADMQREFADVVPISASRAINLERLREKIMDVLEHTAVEHTIIMSHRDYGKLSRLHDFAEVLKKEFEDDTVRVTIRIPQKSEDRLKKLLGSSIKIE